MRTSTLLISAALLCFPMLAGCSYHDHDDHHGRYKRDVLYCDDVGYARYEHRGHGHYRHHDRHHGGHDRYHDRHHGRHGHH